MSQDHARLLDEGREALLDTAALQLRLIYELKQRRGAGDAPSSIAAAPPLPDAGLHDLVYDLARLSMQSYTQWLKISSKHFDSIVAQLRSATGTPGSESRLPYIVIELSGRPGEQVKSEPFRIANPFRTAIEASFASPLFVSTADPTAAGFHAPTAYWRDAEAKPFRPGESVSLPPGEPTFRVQIRLSPSHFKSGRRYVGDACVLSKGRASGMLRVKVAVQ